jgi:ABC-type dipeptide/oligopeptide/nickel transport system permease subunit
MTVLWGLLRNRAAAFGLGLTALLALLALFAPWVAPYRPDEIHPIDSLVPPSAGYWLGTDDLGRDILSRIVYGARASLMVGAIAVGIAATIGIPLGLVAGYVGGGLDGLVMRLMDALLAFPAILLAIALMAVLGPSLQNAMVAIGIVFVPAFARITRANTLSLREKEFVEAARALGAGSVYIAAGVILPNCPVAIVSEILGDPCTLIIVRDLCGGPKRYGELTSSQPHTSTRTLTKKLRLLEEGGHIVRKVFDEHPPHVEYHLSPRGKGLRPIITAMRKYGAGDEHYS